MVSASRLLHRRPLWGIASRVTHLMGAPKLHDLYTAAALFSDSPAAIGSALFGRTVDYADEYESLAGELDERARSAPSHYPGYFTIEDRTAELLYAIIRHRAPELVVEVGVADGRSTQVILAALDRNEKGRLVSVDIKDDVGGAAVGHTRWSLRIHRQDHSDTQLRALLDEIGPPDVLFHDAGHSFFEQFGDYLAAWDRMRPGGVLLSDDVDNTWAFLDIVRLAGTPPCVLMDRRKAVGALVRPGP
jgi:predicted O-methyltransferase YrrM